MTNGQAMSFPAMAPDQGRLIAIDAIDGAGKNEMADALILNLEERGLRICKLDQLAGRAKTAVFPRGDNTYYDHFDALCVSQPTYGGIGLAIREEIMREGSGYDARATAEAFALDRHVLYQRTVLPFLRGKPGRLVLQVRGLMSSLTYQTLQAEDEGNPLSIEELLRIPGNQLELSRPPDLALLLICSPSTARQRLSHRASKVDGDKFAHPHFQARLSERYRSREIRDVFERLGTRIVEIDAERDRADVAADCRRALDWLLAA